MASSYPGALDSFATTRTDADTTATTHPDDHNNANDALNNIETELGVNPSASFVDVATRLNMMTTVRKTADQTNTTITPANVTDLVFPTVIGGSYRFDFLISYSSSLATAGIGLSVTCPATAAGGINYTAHIGGFAAAGASSMYVGEAQASNTEIVSTAVAAINTFYTARIFGICHNPTAAGSLQLRFRAEVAATITIKAGAQGVLWTS